jgi:hypothetical protein
MAMKGFPPAGRGAPPTVRLVLSHPPTDAELRELAGQLGTIAFGYYQQLEELKATVDEFKGAAMGASGAANKASLAVDTFRITINRLEQAIARLESASKTEAEAADPPAFAAPAVPEFRGRLPSVREFAREVSKETVAEITGQHKVPPDNGRTPSERTGALIESWFERRLGRGLRKTLVLVLTGAIPVLGGWGAGWLMRDCKAHNDQSAQHAPQGTSP